MFRMLIHPSSGACDLFVELFQWVVLLLFDVCSCYVVVWLWWCGIRIQAEALVPPHQHTQHVSDVNTSILRSLRLICWVISWVVLLWFDVCWCYVVAWLWWCGIRMKAEALVPPHQHTQHVSDVNTSILRSLQLICWVISVGCIALVRCVLVLRCGLAVVVWY